MGEFRRNRLAERAKLKADRQAEIAAVVAEADKVLKMEYTDYVSKCGIPAPENPTTESLCLLLGMVIRHVRGDVVRSDGYGMMYVGNSGNSRPGYVSRPETEERRESRHAKESRLVRLQELRNKLTNLGQRVND